MNSRAGNTIGAFTAQSGNLEGTYARNYAAKIIGQPADSAIYFGVDVDATAAQVNSNVLPYFKAVAAAFGPDPTLPSYQIGVYGSGATCDAVMSAGLASHAWLAQSTGWRNYKPYSAIQKMVAVAGDARDGRRSRMRSRSGEWRFRRLPLGAPPVAQIGATSASMQVIARSGVRLRAGPARISISPRRFRSARDCMSSRRHGRLVAGRSGRQFRGRWFCEFALHRADGIDAVDLGVLDFAGPNTTDAGRARDRDDRRGRIR